jgi:transposase InsO family protein
VFARWGNPEIFVSDNGPQLVSVEMKQFLESNGIHQVPVPTYSPSSNGKAERAVQTFKVAMKKASRE